MGKKWANAPLMYTVAQIRFNQILSMESFVPMIQEKMRNIGFPDYRKEISKLINFPGGQPSTDTPVVQTVNRYAFGNIEKTSGFILEDSAIAFQTVDYDVFETFLQSFLSGLSVVDDNVRLSFIERIGIRYLSAVVPIDSEELSDYLVPEVLGMSSKITGKLSHSYTETVSTSSIGGLIARTVIHESQVSLPPEIAQTAYALNKRFNVNRLHAVIDLDGFYEERVPFNINETESKLSDLHDEIEKSLKAITLDHAHKKWESNS